MLVMDVQAAHMNEDRKCNMKVGHKSVAFI